MERIDKINYYLDIAETVLERGTCLRRKFGCAIIKNDEVISTGYAGAPRGRRNCCDINYCAREKLNIPSISCIILVASCIYSFLNIIHIIEINKYDIRILIIPL